VECEAVDSWRRIDLFDIRREHEIPQPLILSINRVSERLKGLGHLSYRLAVFG